MADSKEVLRSLATALAEASDETKSYLIGYAEGLIAGRQGAAGASDSA